MATIPKRFFNGEAATGRSPRAKEPACDGILVVGVTLEVKEFSNHATPHATHTHTLCTTDHWASPVAARVRRLRECCLWR